MAKGLESISQGSSKVHQIDPRSLHIKKDWNVRDWSLQENKDHIEQLAWSIGEVGVKQPLTVVWQDNKAWIDDGECRYKAIMLCIERGVHIKTVPCRAAERIGANMVDRRFNRYLANTGKQFNELELARDFKWFLDQGWQQTDIAKKAGLSQGRVSQILATLELPQPFIAAVGAGKVSTSLAKEVVREHGTKAEQVLKDGIEAAGDGKVKPEHVGKVSAVKAVKEAFEYSDVDPDDDEVCIIKMPKAHWEVIRDLLKL